MLNTYRELIALRKARPELSDPWLDDVEVDVDEDARTIVLHRGGLRLAVNLGDDPVTFDLDVPVGRVLLASERGTSRQALTLDPVVQAIAELGGGSPGRPQDEPAFMSTWIGQGERDDLRVHSTIPLYTPACGSSR